MLGKPAVDGGVVMGADAKGTLGKLATLLQRGLSALLVDNVEQQAVFGL